MTKTIVTFALSALMVVPAFAGEPTPLSTIHQWVDGFNRRDPKSAIALCSDQAVVIDDVAPYAWRGATACADWFRDVAAQDKSDGVEKPAISVGDPWHAEVSGVLAYIVAPTTLSFVAKGAPTQTKVLLTVTLRKEAHGWRITGLIWSDSH